MIVGHIHAAKATRVKVGLTLCVLIAAYLPMAGIVASLLWLWVEED